MEPCLRRRVPSRPSWSIGRLGADLESPRHRRRGTRLPFGSWRGQRLLEIEPHLEPGGKHEMATLARLARTPPGRETARRQAVAAVAPHRELDPTSPGETVRPKGRPP